MKCLLINLDRSPDRLEHMTKEFAEIGIAFERVAAVDAQAQPELADIPMDPNPLTQLRLTNSEIACFLSHRACWAIIAEGKDGHGAVFEDDIVFSEKAGALLGHSGWIPADADIVKLETFFRKTRLAWKRFPAGNGFSTSRMDAIHIGAAGYILSKQAARDLINDTVELGIPVDHVLFNPRFATSSTKAIYQLSPALCVQERFLRPAGLPSLLLEERQDQWVANIKDRPRKTKTLAMRIDAETRKLVGRIADIFQLKQRKKVVEFRYHGERVRPAHTHNREKAL